MVIIDIIFGALLCWALYKGIKNGLFVELGGLIALIAGVYFALKFSNQVGAWLQEQVSWNEKYVSVVAFAITFIAVVFGVRLLAKLLTKIVDFAFLGWINKLAGGVFSMLKTVLILSVLIVFFEKINDDNWLLKQETIDESVLYSPTKEVADFIYPELEKWYEELKTFKAQKKSSE